MKRVANKTWHVYGLFARGSWFLCYPCWIARFCIRPWIAPADSGWQSQPPLRRQHDTVHCGYPTAIAAREHRQAAFVPGMRPDRNQYLPSQKRSECPSRAAAALPSSCGDQHKVHLSCVLRCGPHSVPLSNDIRARPLADYVRTSTHISVHLRS